MGFEQASKIEMPAKIFGKNSWTWSGSEYRGGFITCKLLILLVRHKQELQAHPPFVSNVCPVQSDGSVTRARDRRGGAGWVA